MSHLCLYPLPGPSDDALFSVILRRGGDRVPLSSQTGIVIDNVAESTVMEACIGCGVSYGFFWKTWCSSRDNARVGVCSAGWCAAGDHSKLSGWHLRRGRSFSPSALGGRGTCCCSVACREAIACPSLGVWAHTHALAETRGRKQRFHLI